MNYLDQIKLNKETLRSTNDIYLRILFFNYLSFKKEAYDEKDISIQYWQKVTWVDPLQNTENKPDCYVLSKNQNSP